MISIIIPCYNSGIFLKDALASIFDYVLEGFEIIIVNDGSTDIFTLNFLNKLKDPRILIINQKNQGLASARNVGVANSKGELLLFLDSDNKILSNYSKWAIEAFKNNSKLGVVYGNPVFFGEVNLPTRFESKPFQFDSLLCGNFIDACAFVKKEAFFCVDGFSVDHRLDGWDDWDLWIKLSSAGWDFNYIDRDCFQYRVSNDSMIGSKSIEEKNRMLQYLGAKHGFIFHQRFRRYYKLLERIEKNPFLYFLKIIFYKYVLRKKYLVK